MLDSKMNDAKLVEKLEVLVSQSAKKLDLPYSQVIVSGYDRNSNGHITIGGSMEVYYRGGVIELGIDEAIAKAMPEELLNSTIEHEMCHSKDMAEDLYDWRVFIAGEVPEQNKFYALVMELDQAYSDYLASQRQITVFGKKAYRTYHLDGLDEFFQETDESIVEFEKMFNSLTPQNKDIANNNIYAGIFCLFKEYIKSYLIGHTSPQIRKPIMDVSRLLVECFDEVNGTDTDWLKKSALLFFTGLAMVENINLVKSYHQSELIRFDYVGDQHYAELADALGVVGFDAVPKIRDRFKR